MDTPKDNFETTSELELIEQYGVVVVSSATHNNYTVDDLSDAALMVAQRNPLWREISEQLQMQKRDLDDPEYFISDQFVPVTGVFVNKDNSFCQIICYIVGQSLVPFHTSFTLASWMCEIKSDKQYQDAKTLCAIFDKAVKSVVRDNPDRFVNYLENEN